MDFLMNEIFDLIDAQLNWRCATGHLKNAALPRSRAWQWQIRYLGGDRRRPKKPSRQIVTLAERQAA
jgi:hypothetical protein